MPILQPHDNVVVYAKASKFPRSSYIAQRTNPESKRFHPHQLYKLEKVIDHQTAIFLIFISVFINYVDITLLRIKV
jgi:hypothetical protein